MQCYGRQVYRDARRVYDSGARDPDALAAALRELIAVSAQRWVRIDAIDRSAPVYQGFHCAWCGARVFGSPFGRKKQYCSKYHLNRASLARVAARREREAA